MSFDPTKPVQTRDGREAGIYSTDNGGGYPIHGWVKGRIGIKVARTWKAGGEVFSVKTGDDLVNIPEYPPLPEVKGGRLEYRGKGWANGGKRYYFYDDMAERWKKTLRMTES